MGGVLSSDNAGGLRDEFGVDVKVDLGLTTEVPAKKGIKSDKFYKLDGNPSFTSHLKSDILIIGNEYGIAQQESTRTE